MFGLILFTFALACLLSGNSIALIFAGVFILIGIFSSGHDLFGLLQGDT